MLRKTIISIILCVALLFILVTLVSAQEPGEADYQMDMNTPTATAIPVESTPIADLPLSGTTTQSGTCPMMSGMDMGSMSGMAGMDMSGMSGMQGMSGMSGMTNMGGMSGMNMAGMSGTMTAYSTPWYNDPWLMLGWVLLVVLVAAILTGSVVGVQALIRRSKPVSSS